MSTPDPFELVKGKKAFPSIPGSPPNYAKDHHDWIKKLCEEFLALSDEVEGLRKCSIAQGLKIEELEREREVMIQNTGVMSRRIEALETALAAQSDRVNTIKKDVEKLGLVSSHFDDNIKRVVEETAKKVTMAEVVKRGVEYNDEFEVNMTLANNKERREKERRARNIIIFGLRRDDDITKDAQQVYDLISILKVPRDRVKRITRLISKTASSTTRPPPFLVELDTPATRESTLRSTGALKGVAQYKDVSIAPDLTPNERIGLKREHSICDQLNRELPADCPFVWRVRSGERTKIDKKSNRYYKATRTEGSSA